MSFCMDAKGPKRALGVRVQGSAFWMKVPSAAQAELISQSCWSTTKN